MKTIIQKKFYYILFAFAMLASCTAQSHKEDTTVTDGHEETAVTVVLSDAQQKAIGIQLGEIQSRNLKTALKVNGRLTLPPQNQASVSLPVGGIIKTITVTEGAFVRKGETLATVESTEFIQLQQDFLQSKSQLEFLKAEYERQKELQKENINATKIFQSAEANYKSQFALYQSLIQKLKLYNCNVANLTPESITNTFTVTAPIEGNIHTISVNIGTFAEPNKQLFDIVDNRFLHIDLTVFEKDISKIHEGQPLTFTDANDPSHLHNATIFSINKAFENGQQAVIAHAKIEKVSETLLPGMYIEARIDIDNSTVPSLPDGAIVNNGNDHYIFVQHNGNTFRRVQVRTGTTDRNFTEVIPLEELMTNQKVVVEGAYYLLSELTKGEGEHHH